MSNTIQIRDNQGQAVYPITDESLVIGLNERFQQMTNRSYTITWDGTAEPTVANIPAGVVVTYNETNYTGTLAASENTFNYIYLVKNGNNYDQYVTSSGAGTYTWVFMGTTEIDLSDYATKAEVNQLGQEVSENTENIVNLQQEIDSIQPIIIEGNVTNAPDEEDITTDENDLLKFANRPTAVNQMGYFILRKNKTFAEQVTKENTIYEIRYEFDLEGEEVVIPEGCVLKFEGGKLSNGTIEGDATNLSGCYIFEDIIFEGTFVSEQLDIDETHFKGDVDFYGVMECSTGSLINLGMDINVPTKDVRLLPNLNLNGNGHTIKVVCLAFAQTANVKIKNCIFDCSIAESTLLHVSGQEGGFIDLLGDGTNNIEITDCKFNDIPGGFSFTYFRDVLNVRVENCEFDGTLDPSNVQDNGGYTIYLYTIKGSTKINSCRITNCHGVAICGLGNTAVDASFEIKNNFIENIARGGIVFFGGFTHNIFVSNNTINDVNLVESATGADHSCINFHGFSNAVVCNNSINAPKATGIDIDGSLSGSTIIEKGENAKFYGNNIVCRNVIFWVVKNVEIYENVFDLEGGMGLSGQIDVRNNIIKGVAKSSKGVINPERSSSYTFELDITFYGNKVIVKSASTSGSWFVSASGIPGTFRVRGTSAILESNGNLAMIADNAKIVSIEDGYEIIAKRVNLSVASKDVLIPRSRPGALMDVVSFSIDGTTSVSPSVDLSIGLARPGVSPNDSQFGTITISGTYNATTKTHSWTGTRPNNTQQASTGDVYLVCPGGGQDAFITLEFRFLYGYKPYY